MKQVVYSLLSTQKKSIAVLIDPEKCTDFNSLAELLTKSAFAGIDLILIGGSTVTRKQFSAVAHFIKENTSIPLVIFPGASHQLSNEADALLFLSLLSGRNPDYLIGHHIQAAEEVAESTLEVIPTAYLLIDGGTKSSVAYVSQTNPIPPTHTSIARVTALAGKLQGKKLVYLDAGSGAQQVVSPVMISEVCTVGLPVIVGGGIRNIEAIEQAHNAGATLVVIGNKLEEDSDFLLDIHQYKKKVKALNM